MLTRGGLAAQIRAVGTAAGMLALCACGPRDADSDTAPASTPPAASVDQPPAKAAAPLSFAETTADAEVKLSIDKAIGRWPALHKGLYDGEVRALRIFAATARSDRAEMASEDFQPPAYADEIGWMVTAQSPRLLSLQRDEYVYTGGAHPNHASGAIIWDLRAQRPVKPSGLFVAGDDATIDKALCDAIAAEKKARGTFDDWDRGTWPCPSWRSARFVLAPSTEAGKVGGVTFLFDPYDIGPYAEGAYSATLPWTTFRGVIAPAWAGEFGGEPKPSPSQT